MPARAKNFVSLVSFKNYANNNGLRVKKVTVGKKNVYYQAITTAGGYNNNGGVIVGFFNERPNTNRGEGRVGAF